MVMRIERKLAAKIERDFNWKEMPEIVIEDGYEDVSEDGDILYRLYLGSVFNLMPSSKYYTPWATSNLENCQSCQGTGKITVKKNKSRIAKFWHKRHSQNLAIQREEHTQAFKDGKKERCYQLAQLEIPSSQFLIDRYAPTIQCINCGGTGCREAFLDEIYMELLEEKANEIGMSIESGEGDPCDLFIVWHTDEPADTDNSTDPDEEDDPTGITFR